VSETVGAPEAVYARERQLYIARLIGEHGRVRVTDLAARFGVSGVTIRKDLIALETEGRVVRTHGGAIAPDHHRPEVAFDIRERLQATEKLAIGTAAARLVRDGESIVFDASTTALATARALNVRGGWTQLTVITNGIRIAQELAGSPGIRVLMLGGWLRWEALSLVGPLGDGVFSRINVQAAFVGAAGFSLDSGLSDATEEEAEIKRAMVHAAREVVAIVDHTKWGRAAFSTFCQVDTIDRVVTDPDAPRDMIETLRGQDVDIVVADLPSADDQRPAVGPVRSLG
jgi:DeoR/GlpR family transcriptional regulator of sugar metabolism